MAETIVNSVEKPRDYAIDNAKGILITLVVMGHIYFLTGFKGLNESIYLFHMPVFFGLGMVFLKPFSLTYLKDRSMRLLLPFLFFISAGNYPSDMLFAIGPKLLKGNFNLSPLQWAWFVLGVLTLIYLIYKQINKDDKPNGQYLFWLWVSLGVASTIVNLVTKEAFLIKYINQIVWGNWWEIRSVFWFLPALFSLTIMGSLLKKSSWQWQIALVASIAFTALLPQLILWHNTIPWGIDVALFSFPLGYCFQQIYARKDKLTKGPLVALAGACFVILLTACMLFVPVQTVNGFAHRLDLAQLNLPWLQLPLIYLLALVCWTLLLGFTKKTIFCGIGTKTMPIFALHGPLLYTIKANLSVIGFLHPYLQFGIITAVTLLIPYLIAICFERIDRRFAYLGLA